MREVIDRVEMHKHHPLLDPLHQIQADAQIDYILRDLNEHFNQPPTEQSDQGNTEKGERDAS